MKKITELLRNNDPLADDALSQADVQSMRNLVRETARKALLVARWWPQPVGIGAIVILMLAVGITNGGRLTAPERSTAAVVMPEVQQERRQLQFATPGGTRIIWVFDPEFTLKETTP
jgi:hypothetical protein